MLGNIAPLLTLDFVRRHPVVVYRALRAGGA